MSPAGVMSEHQKTVRFRKFILKRKIKGEPIPKSYLGGDEGSVINKPEVNKTTQEPLSQPLQQGN